LYIVISSDLGLCGGYNQNVYKAIREADASESSYVVCGNKASSYYRYRDADVVLDRPGITAVPSFSDSKEISDFALNEYSKGRIDKIVLVYTKFVNSVTFEPTLLQLLPIAQSEERSSSLVEYEPSPEAVLETLVPKYCESLIFGGMIESLASEQASRRMAMENATDNAEELIDKLTVEFNRARQAAITQEISEIVAGADAL
jgi:F-type H+-transporting ATPase subunit gamma